MREIKFRYRIKYGDEVRTDIVLLSELENKIFDFTSEDVLSRDEYTGLKDKNGKEIYEGDVVRYKLYPTEIIGVVEFNERIGGGYSVRGGEKVETFYDIPSFNFEVIGNIYENPNVI